MKKLILLLLIMFCTGCNNYREINSLAVVGAYGVELIDNEYKVSAQVVNVDTYNTQSPSNESPIYMYYGNGETVFEAVRNIQLNATRKLFFAQTKVIVIDDSVIYEGMESFLDFIARDKEMGLNYELLVTTEASPEDILSTLSPMENFTAISLYNDVETAQKNYGTGYLLTVKEFLEKYLSYGINNIFTDIGLTKNNEKNEDLESLKKSNEKIYTTINGLITFDKDKKMIKLSKNESIAYNLITNHITNIVYTSECNDKDFSIEVLNTNFNFEEKLKSNNITINGSILASVAEYTCEWVLDSEKTLSKLKKIVSEKLEKEINDLINMAQENNNDFIGLGNFIYKKNPKYFDFKNRSWDKEGFKNVDVSTKINIDLVKQGNLKGELKNEKQ